MTYDKHQSHQNNDEETLRVPFMNMVKDNEDFDFSTDYSLKDLGLEEEAYLLDRFPYGVRKAQGLSRMLLFCETHTKRMQTDRQLYLRGMPGSCTDQFSTMLLWDFCIESLCNLALDARVHRRLREFCLARHERASRVWSGYHSRYFHLQAKDTATLSCTFGRKDALGHLETTLQGATVATVWVDTRHYSTLANIRVMLPDVCLMSHPVISRE